MQSDFNIRIRSDIADFLAGSTDLHALADGLAARLAVTDLGHDDEELGYGLRLLFAEHVRGDRSDDDVRGELLRVLQTTRVQYPEDSSVFVMSGSGAVTIVSQSSVVGARRSLAAALS